LLQEDANVANVIMQPKGTNRIIERPNAYADVEYEKVGFDEAVNGTNISTNEIEMYKDVEYDEIEYDDAVEGNKTENK
jgi:hypothetical protein